MSKILVVPLDREGVGSRPISARFRSQLCYFMGTPSSPGIPPLGEGEFWFDRDEVNRWLDDGVFYLVSPLDSANVTEVELSEEQEEFLNWLQRLSVRGIRVVET